MAAAAHNPAEKVTIGVHALPIWPKDQKVQNWRDTGILVTQFADHPLYAPDLRATAIERSTDPALAQQFDQSAGVGSAKVYDIDKWPSAAASLVHARALALFRRATGCDTAVVDLCWASVYHDADLCLPHSHPRTLCSVLYVLDLGDNSGANNGTFYFADPRLAPCCREEEGYMSTPAAPTFKPGMMILFPGKAVHFVTPYHGERPRLTMSWNLNKVARAGDPLPESARRPD
jgi:hypothetical protein